MPDAAAVKSTQLLIAIPTFNRAPRLRDTLEALAPQLTPEVSVLLLDNHSTDDTPRICEAFRSRFPNNVTVSRNNANVGVLPNVMKCFEAAQAGWLWPLPDDDEILPDAISLATSVIERHPTAVFVNFSTSLLKAHGIDRDQEIIFSSLDDFLARCDSFGNTLFLTATFYNCEAVRKELRTAYLTLHTFAPHVAIQLLALAKPNAIAVQSDVRIANWGTNVEWSNKAVSDGMTGLLRLVSSANGRHNLNQLIEKEFPFSARSRSRLSAAFNAAADGPAALSDRIAKCGTITAFTGRYRLHLVLLLVLQLLDTVYIGQGICFVRSVLDRLRKRKVRSANGGALADFENCERL
ncbi:MAG: glycosyltransferase family A protein [Pirellulales bacterium]